MSESGPFTSWKEAQDGPLHSKLPKAAAFTPWGRLKATWCLLLRLKSESCSSVSTTQSASRKSRFVAQPNKPSLLFKSTFFLTSPLQELTLPDICTSLKFFKDKLCSSFATKFRLHDLKRLSESSDVEIPAKNDSALGWVHQGIPLVPMAAFKIKNEFLLCYNGTSCYCRVCMNPPELI